MRYGVIADVHGNLPALEAVLERLEAEAVDAYLCAGDLVGYGPFPNECVARVASLRGLVCVAGNHDLIALGRLSHDRCIRLARETLAWTARTLDAPSRDFLGALPLDAHAPGGVVVTHGALGDPQEYVRSEAQVQAQLAALGPGDRALVLGHTHEPMLAGEDPLLLNPGSVGQSRSRDARARFAILDPERRAAELIALEYDVGATKRALRERGLPANACHLRPRSLPRRVAGRAARAVLRR